RARSRGAGSPRRRPAIGGVGPSQRAPANDAGAARLLARGECQHRGTLEGERSMTAANAIHRACRRSWRVLFAVLASQLLLAGCSAASPNVLEAAGPFLYPAAIGPAFDRVAILVTVANRTGDDLAVNPADFVARDG